MNGELILPFSRCLESAQLKPLVGTGNVEVEISADCNGKLADFTDTFWQFHNPMGMSPLAA